MNLTFVTECRFYKTADGKYYADDMSYTNSLWERYLKEFDSINVVARVFETSEKFDESFLVDNVQFCPIYPFDTIFSFAKNIIKVKKGLRKFLSKDTVTIVRGAGPLGFMATSLCVKQKIKFGIEIIGDPYEVYAPGVITHPLRPVLRKLFTDFQKKAVRRASAVIYVTKYALQKRYPALSGIYTTFASDVFLNQKKIAWQHKKLSIKNARVNLISIGSLNQMYKSPDMLIKAIKILKDKGIQSRLVWLGNGKFQQDMEELAKSLEIQEDVIFPGAVSSDEVTRYLDESDIFLLVSRTEGLPRAVVEAMARGLPCIGTNVGGIPELLQKEALVQPESAIEISNKIEYFLNNVDFSNNEAKINLENSKEYSFEALDSKRSDFYRFLKTNHR
ncbi:GDP-mannose-dependent alpha-(1-6)-phosphatidylinositol monomannoside mannosyltransferase [compost metagenome]